MGSHDIFGTNGASSSQSGILPPSLLDSASLSTPLDDNSSLIGLQKSLSKTPSGFALINSELSNLSKSDTTASSDKNLDSNTSGVTHYIPTAGSIFNSSQLFNTPQISKNIPLLQTNSTSKNFYSTFEKDPLTGNTASTPLVNSKALRTLTGNQNALTQAQMLADTPKSTQSSQTPTPNFAIRTQGTISINGRGDFDGNPKDLSDDARIYAAKGFTINGKSALPVQIDAAGNPIHDSSGKLVLVDKAVAVSSGYTVTNGPSKQYAGLIPPPVIPQQTVNVPAYTDLKQRELTRRIPSGTPTVTFNIGQNPINNAKDWLKKFPPTLNATNPTVVRVIGGSLNIPHGLNLNNYAIAVDSDDINFNGNCHNLNNVVLITNNGNINLSNVQSQNLSVFASGSINMNSSARFGGSTLLATGSCGGKRLLVR